MKSISSGYASLNYEFKEYRPSNMKRVAFLINGEEIDALLFLVHESKAARFAKKYC
jgi:GTP-binding protein LepA